MLVKVQKFNPLHLVMEVWHHIFDVLDRRDGQTSKSQQTDNAMGKKNEKTTKRQTTVIQ